MARSAAEILTIYHERKEARGSVLSAMKEIRDIYNSDIAIPLPEMDEKEKPFVANLVTHGIDHQGMRIASTTPEIHVPPTVIGEDKSEEEARTRRYAHLSWWEESRIQRKLRRRARHLVGYGMSPTYIKPNYAKGIPEWEVMNPLGAFPAPSSDPDDVTPTDCIFSFVRNEDFIRLTYPEAYAALKPAAPDPNRIYELIRYVDEKEITLVVARVFRPEEVHRGTVERAHNFAGVVVHTEKNLAKVCTAVVPGRVTLDRIQGAFDALVGMYTTQAKLMALEVIAVEKAIFPDIVIQGAPGDTPRLVSGWHDGRTGKANIVSGGQAQYLNAQPGFQTDTTIDRLERNQRVVGGVPAQWGGESPSNIRTGRAGEVTLSAAVDFPIQEHQETLALALEEENKRAVAVARGYFGEEKKSFQIPFGGRVIASDYTPEDFSSDYNRVFYPMAGADANALVVGIGQRIGLDLMSRRSARQMDPFIPDHEREEEYVNAEQIERIVWADLEQQASQGAVPLVDLARIAQLVLKEQKDIITAITTAQREAQERQAQQAPPDTPEAQPGLAQPGQGAEAQASIAPVTPSQSHLAQLLGSIGQTEQRV